MTTLLRPLLASLLFLLPALAHAQDHNPLPFPISVGGQAAQVTGKGADATFAKIANPVAADAPLEFGTRGEEMIIINVVAADEKGTPQPTATPTIIMIQGGTKSSLDKTMDGKKLAAGNYLLAAVTEGKTAHVLLTVK
jgi:hypothetical protein